MKYLFSVLLSFFSLIASGQYQLSINAGYASYLMTDLKEFQEELRKEFPVTLQVNSSFPAYWYYEVSLMKSINSQFFAGGSLAYGSSGGRISYSDYSGSIISDQLVNYFSFGFPVGIMLNPENKSLLFQLDFRPGIMMSNFELTTSSVVGVQYQDQSIKFHSYNASIQPGLVVTKKVKSFGVVLQAGYHITAYSGKLYLNDDDQYYLLNSGGDPIKMNWSGFRASLGLCYIIN